MPCRQWRKPPNIILSPHQADSITVSLTSTSGYAQGLVHFKYKFTAHLQERLSVGNVNDCVPQGTLCGPVCFLLHVDDFQTCCSTLKHGSWRSLLHIIMWMTAACASDYHITRLQFRWLRSRLRPGSPETSWTSMRTEQDPWTSPFLRSVPTPPSLPLLYRRYHNRTDSWPSSCWAWSCLKTSSGSRMWTISTANTPGTWCSSFWLFEAGRSGKPGRVSDIYFAMVRALFCTALSQRPKWTDWSRSREGLWGCPTQINHMRWVSVQPSNNHPSPVARRTVRGFLYW